ncbi:hypothetical protein ACLOJK_019498, partial [Asimina triloba]
GWLWPGKMVSMPLLLSPLPSMEMGSSISRSGLPSICLCHQRRRPRHLLLGGFVEIHGFKLPDAIEEDEAGSCHCPDGMNVTIDDRRRSKWAELAVAVNLAGSDQSIGARRRCCIAGSLWGRWSIVTVIPAVHRIGCTCSACFAI